MSVVELTGQKPDPHCVHCVMAPVLQAFIVAHPNEPHPKIIGDLLQLVAEYIASTAPDPVEAIHPAVALLVVLTRESYQTLVKAGLR